MRNREAIFCLRRHPLRLSLFALACWFTAVVSTLTVYGVTLFSVVQGVALRQFELEVYLQPTLSGPERDTILVELKRAAPPGTSFRYVSANEAREKYMQEFGSDLLELLGENPLPASYLLTFPDAQAHPSVVRRVQKLASSLPGVDEAVFESELAAWVEHTLAVSGRYLLYGGIVVALIGLLLAYAALRSAVHDSLVVARTLLMLGATPSDFRRPYKRLGAVLALLAGGVALSSWWIANVVIEQVGWSFAIPFPQWVWSLPAIMLCMGWLLGWLATHSVRRQAML